MFFCSTASVCVKPAPLRRNIARFAKNASKGAITSLPNQAKTARNRSPATPNIIARHVTPALPNVKSATAPRRAAASTWRRAPVLIACLSCSDVIRAASLSPGAIMNLNTQKGAIVIHVNAASPLVIPAAGQTYWKFDDGRAICNGCHSRAVVDENEIRKIWQEVTQLLQKQYGMNVDHPLNLNIKPLNSNSFASARRAKEGLSQASPLSGSELGLYRYKDGKADVFLLYGIPIEMVYETAAHEYAHAWQTENCSPKQSIELKEGFAQWIAAQLLKSKSFKMSLIKWQF